MRLFGIAGLSLAASIACAPAHAIFRAYLASDGNDANPCTLQLPCRLLPAAMTAVDDGGEIWMLDSANYNTGPVSVTKSVSILAVPGVVGSVVTTGGGSNSGLAMGTPGVKVSLRNLVFVQLGSGEWGINNTAAAELTIQDCEFANLGGIISGGALNMNAPAGKVTIRDTTVRNSNSGMLIGNGSKATLERVRVINNTNTGVGVINSRVAINDSVISGNQTGMVLVASSGSAYGTLANSKVSNNAYGLNLQNGVGSPASMVVFGSTFSHNTTNAIHVLQDAVPLDLTLDGNVFTHNAVAVNLSQGTPTVYSRLNNTLRNNAGGDTLTATPLAGQ